MDVATDNLTARILLTVAALGYTLVLVVVDFGKTHATNPLWTPHARFHVVWQVTSYCGIGAIALWLTWSGGPVSKLWLSAALSAAVYGGFFVTAFAMRLFGGALLDVNGVPPITTINIGGKPLQIDANVTSFGLLLALVVVAGAMIR
jgi:hypothetical protein